MTMLDVYIGKLANGHDPFDQGGDWNIGNVPQGESSFFPPRGGGDHPHSLVVRKIREGLLGGRQVDWGGWVARVSKSEILAFIFEVYGNEDVERNLMPHLYERYRELISFVQMLPDEGYYALVAVEF